MRRTVRLVGPDELRAACLGRPGAAEDFPFPRYPDRSAFKIGGKVFAISSLRQEPLLVSLKCDPDLAVRLRAGHEAIQPGYRLSKRHWNTVSLDGSLPPELVISMIEDSYDLVLASLAAVARAAIGRGRPAGG
jgi:predicted DNA-binding protein (MmcQ/YjbR family)